MISEKKCLQILEEECEKNKKNPFTDLYFMTLCLKQSHIRKQVYLNMQSSTKTDQERQLLFSNTWGEDRTIIRLIKNKKMPLQYLLKYVYKMQDIEWDMDHNEIYDRTHLVVPMLEKLTTIILPIWKEEVLRLKIDKNHPDIRKIIHFALNLRDYDKEKNEDYINFFLKLLNENF